MQGGKLKLTQSSFGSRYGCVMEVLVVTPVLAWDGRVHLAGSCPAQSSAVRWLENYYSRIVRSSTVLVISETLVDITLVSFEFK